MNRAATEHTLTRLAARRLAEVQRAKGIASRCAGERASRCVEEPPK